MGLSEARDEATNTKYWQQLIMSVLSAKEHAPSLQPVLIWLSPANDRTKWFEKMGGVVLYHKLSFFHMMQDAVAAGKRDSNWLLYDGAYARLDAPHLSKGIRPLFDPEVFELEYIFYTDVDVIFFKDVTTCSLAKPRYVMYGPETVKGHPFNTGVMLMNVSAVLEEHDALLAFAREKAFDFVALDQGMLNEFYEGRITPLPDEFNWKVYWGRNPDIHILHFHGPKPAEACYQCFINNVTTWETEPSCECTNPGFPVLFNMANEADGAALMRDANDLYRRYSAMAQTTARMQKRASKSTL